MCHEGNAAIVTAFGPVLLFVQNLYHGILPSLRYFPLVPHPLDHPVKLPEHGRVVVYPEFEEFNREFVWSHCLRICHRPQGPNQLVFCRFNPEDVCDRPLGELFDDVESELIGFRVEKGPEERRSPSEDKPWVSQHYAPFITDVLRVNLPRVVYVQGLAALVEPPLVALAQILLHTLDVSFKESFVGIGTDPVGARIFSPDSPHKMSVLGVSPLPLPGCSSRGRRHADLCFYPGVSPPSSPRQPGRSRRRNPFCYLQYGCRKDSLHIINTAAAWRKRAEVVSDHCRYLLAQMGVSRQSSPVDRRRSLCLPHRSVAGEATKQFHMC